MPLASFFSAFRLPLPCRVLPWRRWSHSNEVVIGEPLPHDTAHGVDEAGNVFGLAVVEPVHLFIEVAEQMERLNTHVRSFDCSLKQTPEVFQSVGVDVTSGITDRMVNDLVGVVFIQSDVGFELIGMDSGTGLDRGPDTGLEVAPLGVGDNTGFDYAVPTFALALQEPHNHGLTDTATGFDGSPPFIPVHVAGLTANEGLVNLHLAFELLEGPRLHGESDPVEHEPRCLLGHTDRAGQFVGTDPVLGVDQEPQRGEPLAQTDRAILEDRAELDGELFFTGFALPDTAGREIRSLDTTALRTSGFTVRPAQVSNEVDGNILIGEVLNDADKGTRGKDSLVHGSNIQQEGG